MKKCSLFITQLSINVNLDFKAFIFIVYWWYKFPGIQKIALASFLSFLISSIHCFPFLFLQWSVSNSADFIFWQHLPCTAERWPYHLYWKTSHWLFSVSFEFGILFIDACRLDRHDLCEVCGSYYPACLGSVDGHLLWKLTI